MTGQLFHNREVRRFGLGRCPVLFSYLLASVGKDKNMVKEVDLARKQIVG